MDNNAMVVLVIALISLQNVVTTPKEGRIALLPTFSG